MNVYPQFEVPAGASFSRDLQAVDYSGQPQTVFLGSDTLAGVIWPAGATADSKLAVTPTVTWIDAPSGTWRFQLHSADTAAIVPGNYRVLVTATRGPDSASLLDADLVVSGVGGTLAAPGASPVADQTGTALGLVAQLYCTDENIAVCCVKDFLALVPPSQRVAAGADGIFAPSDAWTLSSASNDFAAQGVTVGSVVWLKKPASAFPAGGDLLAVSAVNGTSLTLRRLGMAANRGLPPAPAAGLTGVEFQVSTFTPQIEGATYAINRRWSIDPTLPGRRPSDIADLRALREACVYAVLADRYADETITNGDYAAKLAAVRAKEADAEARLEIRWSSRPDDTGRTNWFNTRIIR